MTDKGLFSKDETKNRILSDYGDVLCTNTLIPILAIPSFR